MSGCNCDTFEGIVWLGLGIAALALYYCEISTPNTNLLDLPTLTDVAEILSSILYITYFYNPECSAPPANDTLGWLNRPLPGAERTWQWAVAYTAVSAAWVLISIALGVAGVAKCKGCAGQGLISGSWLLVTLGVLVMDVVASIQYGMDIGKILDSESLLVLLKPLVVPGSYVEQVILDNLKSPEATLPSVIVTLITSKCAVLWIINAILWLGVAFTTTCCSPSKPPARVPPESARGVPAVSPSATSTVRQDEFAWRGGPNRNHAYQAYDEHNYEERDYRGHNSYYDEAGQRSSLPTAELRGQRPWSYLQPLDEQDPPRPLSPTRVLTPQAEEWSLYPSLDRTSAVKLPRPTLTPSAPDTNFYQYPYNQDRKNIYAK